MPPTLDLDSLYAAIDALYARSPGLASPQRRSDVFRAFHLTPLDSVRVVILGEDPYPDPTQAHGLAFSMPSSYTGRRPQSLGTIFGALRHDLKFRPRTNDLTPWATRGMLLANVALTHRVGASGPDLMMWGEFTRAVLRLVNAKPDPVAWLLWGEFAIECADETPVSNPSHQRFENAHPRAGRSDRLRLSQDPPFTKTSVFLGTDPDLDWAL